MVNRKRIEEWQMKVMNGGERREERRGEEKKGYGKADCLLLGVCLSPEVEYLAI